VDLCLGCFHHEIEETGEVIDTRSANQSLDSHGTIVGGGEVTIQVGIITKRSLANRIKETWGCCNVDVLIDNATKCHVSRLLWQNDVADIEATVIA
jgi:hypothetical protein